MSKDRVVWLVLDLPRDGAALEAQKAQGMAAPGHDSSLQISCIANANSPDIFMVRDGPCELRTDVETRG